MSDPAATILVSEADRDELRHSLRRLLEEKSPEAHVRRLAESPEGKDERLWRQLSSGLGLAGLTVPEGLGGAGFSPVESAVVFEELGRALACPPFYATVGLAVNLLVSCADEAAKEEFLPAIVDGSATATVALAEGRGGWQLDAVTLRASRSGDGRYLLDGVKDVVIDGHTADVVFAVGRTREGPGIFAVRQGAPGLAAEPLDSFDATRKLARLTFRETPADPVGQISDTPAAVSRMMRLAGAALAAEQVGAADRVLEMAVSYAATRTQFGRTIGSFQAIKHRCAELLVDLEGARAASRHAALALAADLDGQEAARAVVMAGLVCSDVFIRLALANIQIHGGIGFTWEHPAHLYVRRAQASRVLLGDPVSRDDELLSLIP